MKGNCRYCNGDLYDAMTLFPTASMLDVEISSDGFMTIKYFGGNSKIIEARSINYCPMCGRCLK